MSTPKAPAAAPFAAIDDAGEIRREGAATSSAATPTEGADDEPPTLVPVPKPSGRVPVARPPLPKPSVPPVAHAVFARVAARTDKGRVRTDNEDAFAIVDLGKGDLVTSDASASGMTPIRLDGGLLLAVSDGMGGQAAGEVASAIVVDTLRRAVSSDSAGGADALRRAVEDANEAVTREAERIGVSGMGATVVALVLKNGAAWTAEVGDSRLYVLRDRALTRLTRDQTQAQLLVDRGVVSAEDAARSAAKNILLQACGTVPTLIVAQQRIALCRGDRFLLCSDGLTNHVSDDVIASVLSSPAKVDEAADFLLRSALEGGGRDNVTVIVADVGGLALPSSRDTSIEASLETIRAFAVAEDDEAPPSPL